MMDDDLRKERRYGLNDYYLTFWEALAFWGLAISMLGVVALGIFVLMYYVGVQ